MWQNLKNDVAVPRTKTMTSQGRETKGVCGVVREVEAAFHGKGCVARVLESSESGALQTCELGGIGGLGDKMFARSGKPLKRGAHLPRQ
jgi:hypothetical protein